MGFVIAGLALFAAAALSSGYGYTWLVALTGALAVVYGACTMALRSHSRFRISVTEPKGTARSGRGRAWGRGLRPPGQPVNAGTRCTPAPSNQAMGSRASDAQALGGGKGLAEELSEGR